jgi:adenylate cyclase
VLFAPDKGDAVVRRYDSHTSELREAGLDENGSDLVHFAVRAAEKFTGQNIVPRYNEILPYQGPPATFEYIPVEEILMDAEFKSRSAHFKERDVFRDKLVFYGPIAEIMHDVHATPLGTMPGVEIHAQLASSLIKRTRIRDAAVGWERLVSLAIVILCGLILLKLRNPVLQVVAVVATLGLSFGFTHLMFLRETYFPTVPWLFSGGFTALAGIVYLFVLERLERAQVRKVFGRFVSKRIAEVVLKNAEEFEHARAGERRAVAVLFSDIRSFTTWSERAAPENLVGQLNEYFESMVPLIEDTDGNAQKFIGDAILAAWGDTHSSGHAEDSRRAVTAALKMRQVLCDLNTRWAGRDDRITIQIGIGINHGTVVTGEVGHSERREFTVLGDGVNFAARLESATKQFHTDCLVGESVEELTRDQFVFREVGFLRVKGKTKPVHIFTPISEKTTPAPEWLADYHRALALHRTRDFENAAALFTDVKSRNGGDDFLCDWYLDLGRRYLRESPREDWDGSETLTEK